MGNVNPSDAKPTGIIIPNNYPNTPSPDKLALLFYANSRNLYHKYDPRAYDRSGLLFKTRQPYIYRYPEDDSIPVGGQGIPLQYGIQDMERVAKFLVSSPGLKFLGKQYLIQGYQAFDETNIYNGSETLLATTALMTGGMLALPKRHVDKSGGLLGGLAALVGVSVSRGTPPTSTVAGGGGGVSNFLTGAGGGNREKEVLPTQNFGMGTGLLRGKTALTAKAILQAKWGIPEGGSSGGIGGFVKNLAKSIIPQVFRGTSQTDKQRADEAAYDWMFKYYNDYTANNTAAGQKPGGLSVGFMGITLKKPTSQKEQVQISNFNVSLFKQLYYKINKDDYLLYSDYHNDSVITTPEDDSYEEKSAVKHVNDLLKSSEKRRGVVNIDSVKSTNERLKSVLDKLNGESTPYEVVINNKDTFLFSSGQPSKTGYDRLYDVSSNSDPHTGLKTNYINSVRMAYVDNGVRTVDAYFNPEKNFGFAGAGTFDKINTLNVLDKSVVDESGGYSLYKPYEDDIIAFFFYDVVNSRYIPFRATVKNINESNVALWDELRFMGRADSLYSYTGFTRNLSFTFTVLINSVVELTPTWNRINYLVSSVKPAGYTEKNQGGNVTNRFVIPPMFMLTIGNLYEYQPIVLTTISLSIPDGASWETVPERDSKDWSYLANMIKLKKKYDYVTVGQVPREVDISISCNVLEKERAQVGLTHFGHNPFTENLNDNKNNVQPNVPYLQEPGEFSKQIITR